MEGWLGRYSGTIYAAMRFMLGLAYACHGAGKLFGAFGAPAATDKPLMLVGGVIELFAGLLIALGLKADYAAFLASGQMAVAYFMFHASSGGFWPIVHKGELAMVYCFVFLYIASHGSGAISLDKALRKS